ncbi:anti-sigma factor antagonist [Altererythrobacter soli]|uniref:Anti-sigma factor antagonist n=1 Tax=Croceibacterium soli TaxID=1739690 RepID=A0A6I4UT52_9SPHN|nr:STAS domain-containing protein [Croceibacterium soli]MXP42082.1 anti-sigma factor antagonist [Croceibacterium soli]
MNERKDIFDLRVDCERLDAAAAPEFKRRAQQELPAEQKRVLLDLDAVSFIDSTGLGVLVSILKQMGPDGRIAVIGARPPVRRLFEITRLDSLFRLYGDADQARQALAG